jgi:hypothetical protein
MRIRLNNPALIGDLVDFLQRNDCEAVPMGRDMVVVSLSHALPYDAARLELDFHLGDWALRHANANAVVLD